MGLIERIMLTPGDKRGEMCAMLHGDLVTILEWTTADTAKKNGSYPLVQRRDGVLGRDLGAFLKRILL